MSTLELDSMVGFQSGLSNDLYHRGPGLSFTGFKEFLKYPAKYKSYRDLPKDSTRLQIKGQAVHMKVLEPELFASTFVHIDGPMNRNPWKGRADEAKEAGKTPLGDSDWNDIIGMSDRIQGHATVKALLSGADKEISCFWKEPEHGILLKCRPDILDRKRGIIGDIKYFNDASFGKFQKQIVSMKYHVQSAWYLDIVGKLLDRTLTDFLHIVVEDTDPYRCVVFVLDDASLERARLDIRDGLAKFAPCYKSDTWPMNEGDPIKVMNLPDWAFAYEGVM